MQSGFLLAGCMRTILQANVYSLSVSWRAHVWCLSRLNSSFFSKSSCFVAENAQLKRAQSQCSISSCKFDSCISRSISISFWILRLMFIFQAKIIGHYAPHLVRLSHGQMSKPPVPPVRSSMRFATEAPPMSRPDEVCPQIGGPLLVKQFLESCSLRMTNAALNSSSY